MYFENTMRLFCGSKADQIACSTYNQKERKKWYKKTIKKMYKVIDTINTKCNHKKCLMVLLNQLNNDVNKNLSGKFFCYAHFNGCNLEGAIVNGADFTRAKGLSNEQKDYLRKNGAINVPIDIEYDLDDSEVGTEAKQKNFRRLRRLYRWLRRLNQNAEVQVNEEELEPQHSDS